MKPYIAIPATGALVYRAYSHNSLTPLGIVTAALTAAVHASHPWSLGFSLLVIFFLAGTRVTKVKHAVKASLTHSSTGSPGGEGPRTHVQVLANSLVASVLILLHTFILSRSSHDTPSGYCWQYGATRRPGDVLVAGIIANYAAVAADTFSSELGILAKSNPRLITAPWRSVPKGTNGGVTIEGILAGALGAFIIAVSAVLITPFCDAKPATHILLQTWDLPAKVKLVGLFTGLGVAGSLLDSLLGAVLQASVIDIRTGKVVEGEGGAKVPVRSVGSLHTKQRAKVRSHISKQADGEGSVARSSALDGGNKSGLGQRGKGLGASGIEEPSGNQSRKVETGWDVLSNNGVNLTMAAVMSITGVLGACLTWDVSPVVVLEEIKYAIVEVAFKAHK